MVDLVLFQQLAGVHVDDVQKNKNTLVAHKEMIKSAKIHSEFRALKRMIYMPLIEEDMATQSLEQDLLITAGKQLDKKNLLITLKGFVTVLSGSIPDGRMMEADITKFGGFFKDEKKPTEVSIKKFLNDYSSYQTLYKIESYMFGLLESVMHNKKMQTVDGLIIRDSQDTTQTGKEFGQVLLRQKIKLDEHDCQLVVDEFDPTGEAMNINLKLLIEEYNDWHSAACSSSKLAKNKANTY